MGRTVGPAAVAVAAACLLSGCSIASALDPGAPDAQEARAPASASELSVGKSVRVRLSGAGSARVASSVDIESKAQVAAPAGLQGPIGAVDVAGNAFTVLGLRVHVDANTRFDGAVSVAELRAGQEVDARGTVDPTGALVAREVRVHIPEITGPIQASSAGANGATALVVLGQSISVPASAPVSIDVRDYQRGKR